MNCRNIARISLCCLLIACWAAIAGAAVKLPAVISNDMVLQRGQPVPIWGWADKGEEVTVSFAGQTLTTKANDEGRWKVVLDKLEVTKPAGTIVKESAEGHDVTMQWRLPALEMIVKGSSGNTITLKNILVGEVWVCSGQSNMQLSVNVCKDAQREIAAAKYPLIRLFTVVQKKAGEPQTDCVGNWTPCDPASVANFSAAAYFFGRQLYKELNVPIGLIHTSWGGTPAEFWTSRKVLEANPALKSLAQGESSCLYNGMIAPLIPYAIRGAIWYQGEANVCGAYQYRTLFPAMIANWRADWGQGDFPFGFVQIAPFSYEDAWKANPVCCAELWEAQSMTLKSSPNTGMVVTVDIADAEKIHPKNGDLSGIHPTNKQDVGRRLALWAMAKVYGKKDLVYSGPIYKSMAVEGNAIRLRFDHVGGGLIASDGKPLVDFIIAGEDQKFLPATATIDGDSIVVHANQVAQPVAVRFAWREDATPNLANKEGLPASPFRTDTWRGVTELK
jgi:sialate O-acetylesterase